jgi:hypothetical protein
MMPESLERHGLRKRKRLAREFLSVRLVILVVLFLGTAPTYGDVSDSTAVANPKLVGKSPTKTMIRSLLVPGWGQVYNEKKIKGALVAAAEISSIVAFFVRRDQINSEIVPVGQPPKRNLYLLTTIGIVFYSVVDAFVDAHLDDFDWGQLSYKPEERLLSVAVRRRF